MKNNKDKNYTPLILFGVQIMSVLLAYLIYYFFEHSIPDWLPNIFLLWLLLISIFSLIITIIKYIKHKKEISKWYLLTLLVSLVILTYIVFLISFAISYSKALKYDMENRPKDYFNKPLEADINQLVYNQPYKVVWEDENGELKFNQEFINKAPENIKALLVLYGYSYGNECWWDGEVDKNRSNLKCALNTVLGVGYQCSDSQITLLQKYFPTENITKQECKTEPYGSTIQDALSEITLTQIDASTFSVKYKHMLLNSRDLQDEQGYPIIITANEIDIFKFSDGHFIKDENLTNKELIKGDWVSVDDKLYKIKITDTEIFNYYTGEPTETIKYHLQNYSCNPVYMSPDYTDEKVLFIEEYYEGVKEPNCSELFLGADNLTFQYTENARRTTFERAK